MAIVEKRRVGKYCFGLAFQARDEQITQMIDLLEHPVSRAVRTLEGRGALSIGDIDGVGSVVVKQFARGGVLRLVTDRLYLRLGAAVRPQLEFEFLERVRELGVLAPEPVAFAYSGALFYRAWLVTKEIANHESLAYLSKQDDPRVDYVVREVARQLGILIDNQILHVDLHPGNVLVDSTNKVYLIDFDRARVVRSRREALRDYYLCRWRRAVMKHQLPDCLSEMMSLHLRTTGVGQLPGEMAREL